MPIEELPRKPGERKRVRVIVEGDGRDAGKIYLITEMPVLQGERWFRRVLASLAKSGIAPPSSAAFTGMAALAAFNPIQLLAWIDDEELMRELMSCVQAWPADAPLPRVLVTSDIEEITTLARMRGEVIAVHVGFSSAASLWSTVLGWAAAIYLPRASAASDTPTSPDQSQLS